MAKNIYFHTTERLKFRTWERYDLPLAHLLWSNPKVVQLIKEGGYSEKEISERLSKEISFQKEFGFQYWPVFYSYEEQFLGCIGFHPLAISTSGKKPNELELGFHLIPDFWGKGFAFEGAISVCRMAFDERGIEKIYAGHHPENENSSKVLKKIGFQYLENRFYQPTGLMHPTYVLKK